MHSAFELLLAAVSTTSTHPPKEIETPTPSKRRWPLLEQPNPVLHEALGGAEAFPSLDYNSTAFHTTSLAGVAANISKVHTDREFDDGEVPAHALKPLAGGSRGQETTSLAVGVVFIILCVVGSVWRVVNWYQRRKQRRMLEDVKSVRESGGGDIELGRGSPTGSTSRLDKPADAKEQSDLLKGGSRSSWFDASPIPSADWAHLSDADAASSLDHPSHCDHVAVDIEGSVSRRSVSFMLPDTATGGSEPGPPTFTALQVGEIEPDELDRIAACLQQKRKRSSGSYSRSSGSSSSRSSLSSKHPCEHCGTVFTRVGNLNVHMRSQHANAKRFACDVCGKGFTRKQTMLKHARRHFEPPPPVVKPPRLMDKNGDPVPVFACDFCTRSFVKKSNLTRHLRIHLNVKPFSCPECNRGFTDSSNMRNHRISKHGLDRETLDPTVPVAPGGEEAVAAAVAAVAGTLPAAAMGMTATPVTANFATRVLPKVPEVVSGELERGSPQSDGAGGVNAAARRREPVVKDERGLSEATESPPVSQPAALSPLPIVDATVAETTPAWAPGSETSSSLIPETFFGSDVQVAGAPELHRDAGVFPTPLGPTDALPGFSVPDSLSTLRESISSVDYGVSRDPDALFSSSSSAWGHDPSAWPAPAPLPGPGAQFSWLSDPARYHQSSHLSIHSPTTGSLSTLSPHSGSDALGSPSPAREEVPRPVDQAHVSASVSVERMASADQAEGALHSAQASIARIAALEPDSRSREGAYADPVAPSAGSASTSDFYAYDDHVMDGAGLGSGLIALPALGSLDPEAPLDPFSFDSSFSDRPSWDNVCAEFASTGLLDGPLAFGVPALDEGADEGRVGAPSHWMQTVNV